jgi:hypothetical protein
MQEALDALAAWAEKWGMEFNVAKCKVMHLGNKAYQMNGKQLGITEEEVDIGVAMVGSLKPSVQCRRVARTAQTVLGQLARGIHNRCAAEAIFCCPTENSPPRSLIKTKRTAVQKGEGISKISEKSCNFGEIIKRICSL